MQHERTRSKNTARLWRCDGAYLGPLTSSNSTTAPSSVNVFTSSCACAELSTIFVGLPPPASTANLFPVCEWTRPWRLTRCSRHFEVLLTVIFSNALFILGEWFRLLFSCCGVSALALLTTFLLRHLLLTTVKYRRLRSNLSTSTIIGK